MTPLVLCGPGNVSSVWRLAGGKATVYWTMLEAREAIEALLA